MEVSGAVRGLLGPTGAEVLVEPERGGSGGFSSSTSVDREEWDSSLNSLLCDRDTHATAIKRLPSKEGRGGHHG